ncbi:MAG: GH25 family lysozyme [Lawsonibacter sp.]|jgi:lysozyme
MDHQQNYVQNSNQGGQKIGGKRRMKGKGVSKRAVFFSILVLLIVGIGLMPKLRIWLQPKPITFQYRNQILEAKKGVPVNEYHPEGFALDDKGRVQYTWDGRQAKTGIDVSFYQKEIDWQAVADDGVDFAIIRLGYRGYTEGGLRTDSQFEANLQGALDAGIETGVYFFSQAITPQEAEEEAEFVLQQLAQRPLAYPVVFDWEFITPGEQARTDMMDGDTLTQCALAFCRTIEAAGYSYL